MSVLLVDAEAGSRARIRSELQDRGVHVAVSTTVAEAHAALALRSFGAVIIEMGLPDGTALEVLDRLRAAGSSSHVIVLGGPTGEGGRVRALERGADDFVVKPCDAGELAARVLAVRRRRDAVADPMVQIGRLRIDLQSREVTCGGEKVELTAKEFDLLAFLADRPGSVFDREQLLNAVWRSASEWQQAATVTEHIRRLRGKLEIDPAHPTLLTTIRGVGYRLDIPTTMPIPRPEVGEVADGPEPGGLSHVRCTPDSDATEQLRRVVDGFLGDLSDAVIVTDLQLHIRSWNAASEQLYGWEENEVLGRHVLDVLRWSKDGDPPPREMWELVGHSARWHGQISQLGRDGSVVEVLSSTTLVRDQAGDPLGIVSVNRAATAARRVSSLEQDTSTASRLRQGLADDEFDVHYQPVVDLANNRLITLEALVRWEHPERGTLLPAEFLDTAESTGVIVELGEVVLGKACRQAAEWRRSGADIHLSVNVSARQLADPGMVERFTSIMDDSGFDPHCLWLEVTETALVEEMEKTSAALRRLVDLGVGVSIDDFGTGWASLTYLQNLPVHALKIDRSFVARAGRRVNDTAIIRSILSLGAELELFVVAEGIETQTQHDQLKKLGCSLGQGYLFGRPAPACDVPIERAARITPEPPAPSCAPTEADVDAARPGLAMASPWLGVRAYPSDEGRAVHIGDISRERLQEQFLRSQRMERIGAQASGVAHDLNNILTPIMMATNVLQAEYPGNVPPQLIDTMASCTARAADLLRQILLFARGVECQPVPVAVEGVLGDVEQLCNDTFPEAVVIEQIPDDGPLVALGDPTQLHQVLLNLCVNARDAMPDGGTIELSARLVEVDPVDVGADDTGPGRYVRIRVRDDGNGMPPEVLDRIFEPFFTTKEHGRGTGLGLATSTGIINAHGGFIRATSTEGVGTTIDVHLPTVSS